MSNLVFLEPDDLNEIPFTTSEVIAENGKIEHGEGHVYVIDNGTGKVKIGKTNNPSSRIKAIETQSGISIIRVYVSPKCFNYQELETKTHKAFKQSRTIGEWFESNFDTVKDFVSSLDLITINNKQQEKPALFPNGTGPEYVALENEVLNALVTEMQSLREEVAVSKALYGSISSDLRRKVIRVTTQFDNLETDFKQQISSLIALDYDYQAIKDIISRKYLKSA